MELNDLANKHYAWLESRGWNKSTLLEAMALVASEVGETAEHCRAANLQDGFSSELADIALRCLGILKRGAGIDMRIEDELSLHAPKIQINSLHNYSALERLALLMIEIGKTMNECRAEKPTPLFVPNLVKVLALTMNIAEDYSINLKSEIEKKIAKNLSSSVSKDRQK